MMKNLFAVCIASLGISGCSTLLDVADAALDAHFENESTYNTDGTYSSSPPTTRKRQRCEVASEKPNPCGYKDY